MSVEVVEVILIQDDQSSIDAIAQDMIDAGHNFLGFDDFTSALSYLNSSFNSADVIVIDKEVSNISCIEFLQIIQKDKVLKHIPVIVQIDDPQPNGKDIKLLQEGASFYITKPINIDKILCLIKASARNYSKNKKSNESEEFSFVSRVSSK